MVCSVHFLRNRQAQLRKAATRYYFRKHYGYYKKGMGQRLHKWVDASQTYKWNRATNLPNVVHNELVQETLDSLKSLGAEILFVDLPDNSRPDIIYSLNGEIVALDAKTRPSRVEIEWRKSLKVENKKGENDEGTL